MVEQHILDKANNYDGGYKQDDAKEVTIVSKNIAMKKSLDQHNVFQFEQLERNEINSEIDDILSMNSDGICRFCNRDLLTQNISTFLVF